jgi:ABC-type transport system involved in cytochrome c biogenesis permease component
LRVAWATLVLLLPVCFVAMPVLTADMVAGEREDGTLEMLELTALRPRDLVLGKFLAAAASVLVLALSTLPFLLLADLAGGPGLLGSFSLIGAAVLYCLPFAAVGIGRSVRSPTRAEAMRSAFRDMLVWPGVGLAIALGGAIGVAILREVLKSTWGSNPVLFVVVHAVSFPAGLVWTVGWDRIGATPWFWVVVPIGLTIHCLRRAWIAAAWMEPVRTAEAVQARRRGRADAELAGAVRRGTRVPTTTAAVPPGLPPVAPMAGYETPWARISRRTFNPVEVLAAIHKRDAAWWFAALAWLLPLFVVGFPMLIDHTLVGRRGFLTSFSAFAWIGLILAYMCMVAPTIVTSERESGTLDSIRMTRLRPADIVIGKLKPRLPEIGALLLGGGLFMCVHVIRGQLSLPSLLLLWASGIVYTVAYAGFGAAASVWCRRTTHAILAGWALLFVPLLLSLALVFISGVIGHWILLPLSPILVVYRCLVFYLPDPTPGGVYFAAADAYTVWGLSLAIHVVVAGVGWWLALKQFDQFLYENRSGG